MRAVATCAGRVASSKEHYRKCLRGAGLNANLANERKGLPAAWVHTQHQVRSPVLRVCGMA